MKVDHLRNSSFILFDFNSHTYLDFKLAVIVCATEAQSLVSSKNTPSRTNISKRKTDRRPNIKSEHNITQLCIYIYLNVCGCSAAGRRRR